MNYSIYFRVTLFLLVVMLITTAQVFAVGTPAGTEIKNVAKMTYNDIAGTPFDPIYTDTVRTVVEHLVSVDVSPSTASQTAGNNIWVYYPVTVTNTSNGSDIYDLTGISSNNWDVELYIDADGDGILDDDEILAGTVSFVSLDADASIKLIARVFVPDNTPSNTQDVLTVTATSRADNTVSDSGVYTTTISAAVLVFTKSQNPSSGIPGTEIEYSIGYENTGTGTADNVTVTDVLNANVTLVSGSITGGGTYDGQTRTITWNIGKVRAGESGSVSFKVTVNADVPENTPIGNVANASFTDSTNNQTRTPSSNTVEFTVTYLQGIYATITPLNQAIEVGAPVYYALSVQNTGNGPTNIGLTSIAPTFLTWAIYHDVNGNGQLDGPDVLLTPAQYADLGSFVQFQTMYFIAADTVPQNTADASVDVTNFTFSTLREPATQDVVTGTTTIKAPVMKLSKSVAVIGGDGRAVPGAVLEYTINYSNDGTGRGYSIVISDIIPQYTTYVPGSIYWNNDNLTDAQDTDAGEFTGTTVVVNLGTVEAAASGTIKFRVMID